MSQVQSQPVIPAKDQATLMTETALKNPGNIPVKFKNADGSINVDALTEAYRQLERKQSQAGQQPPATPVAPAVTPANPLETTEEDIKALLNTASEQVSNTADTFDAILSPNTSSVQPMIVDWTKIQNELVSTGTLSVETVKTMKQAGIPDAVISTTIAGFQAAKREQFQKAASLVGGKEELQKVLTWVNNTAKPEQKQSILEALRGPAGEQVLIGLHTSYRRAVTPEGTPIDTSTGLTSGMGAAATHIVPFVDSREMEAVMNDPKYQTDPAFRKTAMARMAVTRGRSPQEAARLLK